MKIYIWALLPVSLLLLCIGCDQAEKADAGRVTGTSAYREQFGPPPAVKKGTCFAMAGFLPLERDTSRVSAIPIFTYAEKERKELLLRHLISLRKEAIVARPEFINPFPPGTTLEFIESGQDVVRVELNFPGGPPTDPDQVQGILSAVGFSLGQFDEVERVLVTARGKPLAHEAPEGFVPMPLDIVSPGEPRLLQVAGVWEEGAQNPEELSVFFDRPVEVEDIRVEDEDGRTIEGDYYRSVFEMAVVIHPENLEDVRAGMPVEVTWKVVDRLGRGGSGKEKLTLQRIEHP